MFLRVEHLLIYGFTTVLKAWQSYWFTVEIKVRWRKETGVSLTFPDSWHRHSWLMKNKVTSLASCSHTAYLGAWDHEDTGGGGWLLYVITVPEYNSKKGKGGLEPLHFLERFAQKFKQNLKWISRSIGLKRVRRGQEKIYRRLKASCAGIMQATVCKHIRNCFSPAWLNATRGALLVCTQQAAIVGKTYSKQTSKLTKLNAGTYLT